LFLVQLITIILDKSFFVIPTKIQDCRDETSIIT
jgi:hypothetical protein